LELTFPEQCRMPDGTLKLSVADARLVYHECGHAIHNALGRTEYQNMSGTRMGRDTVEIMSQFHELLLSDASFLVALTDGAR
jgi:Zn-dependent oligopeptidase